MAHMLPNVAVTDHVVIVTVLNQRILIDDHIVISAVEYELLTAV